MLQRRSLLAAALAATLAACAASPTPPPAAPARPKLVVLFVVDGLPMRQLTENRALFAPDGFRRFMDQGRWFADAHYAHAHTVTAAGHSVMLSGAYPQRSGIISNEWRDPATGALVYCTQDEAHHYLGGNTTAPLAGTSPRNYKVETVGDVLRTVQPESKVIGISGKDRGAILPAGHKGVAYMYMGETGRFASSSFYMSQHPAWVEAFNAGKPADAYFKKTWAPLLAESAYANSTPDGQAWQVASGNGNRLPAVAGDKMDGPGPRFYGNLLASPFADELTLNFARAAIAGERLGQRGVMDLLSVSLSSHDYVNHAFGPDSRLSQDHLLQLDRHLAAFFATLDATLGKDGYVAALTADHGFADAPEAAVQKGRDAGRLNVPQMIAAINVSLAERFGFKTTLPLVTDYSAGGLLLNEGLIAEQKLASADVQAAVKAELLKMPGVAAAYTLDQILGSSTEGWLPAVRKSWHAGRSAQVQFVTQPGWIPSWRPGGSTHGSPHRYDTHVPLMFWGPGYVGQGEEKARVEVADLAPSLAAVMGLRAPAQAQGHDLGLGLSAATPHPSR
jgi:predicted AlkP superfamily pyrophosphatase or phosphodiesterase